MFLKAELGWLPGFPVRRERGAVVWVAMPRHGPRAPEQTRLERDHLQRATYTWTRLLHRFPHVLPHLVDNVARWREGVPRLLDLLKSAIHHHALLPASLLDADHRFAHTAVVQAASVAEQHPPLRPLIDALTWVTYLNPKELPRALAWMEEHATAIETALTARPGTDGLVTALTLWEIARRDGLRHAVPLLRLAGDPRAYTLSTRGTIVPYMEQWAGILRNAAKDKLLTASPHCPQPRLGAEALAFIDWVIQQNQAIRRRALNLVALLYPDDLLDRWEAWWDEVEPLLTRGRRLASIPQNEATRAELDTLITLVKSLTERIPPAPHASAVLANVQKAAQPANARLHRQIVATLKRLPSLRKRNLLRTAFLNAWLRIDVSKPDAVAALLRAFRVYLTRHRRLEGCLDPWRNMIVQWNRPKPLNHWGLLDTLFAELAEPHQWTMALEALGRCVAEAGEPLIARDGERVVLLVLLTDAAEEVAARFLALEEADLRWAPLPDNLLRCAGALAQDAPQFARLAEALYRLDTDDERLGEVLAAAALRLDKAGWTNLAAQLILDGALHEVQGVGQRVTALRAMGHEADPPTHPTDAVAPAWSRRYPEAFAPALALLAAVAPDARRLAGRVLGKDFPDPEKRQREIAAIAARLADDPDDADLARRLDNLRARTSKTKTLSPARFARRAGQLERATRHAVLRAWQQRLDDALLARLPGLLGVAEAPAWMLEPRQLRVLEPLLAQERWARALGLRLLRERCGPPPWTLLDDPANQAFLARLRALGIDPDPWINPPPPYPCTGANDRTVHIAFEADPLEIFHMGGHFKTCLSPGSFNFFSVFANAADINKQVVYARDDEGRVVGRCLFALSDEGGLLTFEPYCHDLSLGFEAMMAGLAEAMAEAMGTLVVARGQVSCLVAPDWYDDGARDLCHRFDFLEHGSAFRAALPDLALDDVVPTLEAAFAPLPLNALTLPLVLDLSELHDRPALVLPLLPILEACKGLTDAAWLRAARLAHAAGAAGFTHRALRQRAVPYLLATHRHEGWLDTETLAVLVDLEPSTALHVLRRTRPRGVRADDDEYDPHRRTLLARAHEALGRAARAERLRGTP